MLIDGIARATGVSLEPLLRQGAAAPDQWNLTDDSEPDHGDQTDARRPGKERGHVAVRQYQPASHILVGHGPEYDADYQRSYRIPHFR